MDNYKKRVMAKWVAGGKKPMLVGHQGVGKTAFVNALAKELGVACKVINTSTFEGIDANGMPYLVDGELKISLPFWLEGLEDGDVLFLDEFSNAPTEVRNAFLQIIMDKKLPSGNCCMPDVRIIGAMNPADDLESFADFSNAMKDRWAFMPFTIPVNDWREMYADGFGRDISEREKEVRDDILEFLKVNPQMLENRKPVSAKTFGISDTAEATPIEYATPTRRNWDNLAREWACYDEEEDKRFKKDVFIENVGIEAWRNYREFVGTKAKPLDKYNWDGTPDELSQQSARLLATDDADLMGKYFTRAIEKCKQKELLAGMFPSVLGKLIDKYSLEYRNEFPEIADFAKELK